MPIAAASRLVAAFCLAAAIAAGAGAEGSGEPDGPCSRVEWVEVHKEARSLRAWCDDGNRIEMPVALGRSPQGTKRLRGDDRTPEGAYRIAGPARASRFHRFLPIDFPSRADAAEGLADGRIGEAVYRRILGAHRRGALPPQHTALGGHLGLHGQGPRWRDAPPRLDWTHGCIAVGDEEIEALAGRVEPGTPVYIYR